MKKLFAFVILLSSLALGQNVSLSGAFKNPDLTGVTGTLSMKIARAGVKNTCSTPYQIVPTATSSFAITNGVVNISGVLNQDCMSPRVPYYVSVTDTTGRELYHDNWYLPKVLSGNIDVGNLSAERFSGPIILAIPQGIIGTPTGTQTITQPGGTSLVVNGNLIVTSCTGCTNTSATVVGWNSSGNLTPTFDTGLSRESAGKIDFGNGTAADFTGVAKAALFEGANLGFTSGWGRNGILYSGGVLGWSATGLWTSGADTGISRIGSGSVVAVGNGTAGDASGQINTATFSQSSDAARINTSGVAIASNKVLGFSSTTVSGGTTDVGLSRGAPNTIYVGNGVAGGSAGALFAGTLDASNGTNDSAITPLSIKTGNAGVIGFTSGANLGSSLDTGFSRNGAGIIYVGNGTAGSLSGSLAASSFISTDGTHDIAINGTLTRMGSTGVFGFSNGLAGSGGSTDTGISRDSANVVDVGNGTQGNKSGTLNAASGNFTTGITVGTCTGCGGVTSVGAVSPVASSGGSTPSISITAGTNGQCLNTLGSSVVWGSCAGTAGQQDRTTATGTTSVNASTTGFQTLKTFTDTVGAYNFSGKHFIVTAMGDASVDNSTTPSPIDVTLCLTAFSAHTISCGYSIPHQMYNTVNGSNNFSFEYMIVADCKVTVTGSSGTLFCVLSGEIGLIGSTSGSPRIPLSFVQTSPVDFTGTSDFTTLISFSTASTSNIGVQRYFHIEMLN